MPCYVEPKTILNYKQLVNFSFTESKSGAHPPAYVTIKLHREKKPQHSNIFPRIYFRLSKTAAALECNVTFKPQQC